MTQRDEPSAGLTPGEEALAEVEALLCVGDVHEARRMLAAARRLAGPTETGRFDALDLQVARRERVLGPLAAFEDARSRGDWVAARGHAARAAELAEGEDVAAWRHTKELCSAWIRAEWRLSCFEVDVATEGILADCAGGLDTTDDVPACLLAEDGNTLALVSAHERWVFFREVDVAQRRVRRLGWLRAPESLEGEAPVQHEDETIDVVGREGALLQLSRQPLDILRWTSLRPFMLPDRTVSDAIVVPPGRFLWGQFKEPDEDQAVTVVDLAEWRVCRRPATSWFHRVPGAEPPRVLGTAFDESAAIFDERGARVEWDPPAGCRALAAHPSGAGWVALVVVPDPDADLEEDHDLEEAPLGLVELRPDRPPSRPLILPDSYDYSPATLAVSVQHSLAFVLTHAGGSTRIFAYACAPDGLEPVWDHELGGRAALVQDCRGRCVVAIAATHSGLEFATLERSPPRLRAGVEEEPSVLSIRGSVWHCTPAARAETEIQLARELWEARNAGRAPRWVEKLRRAHRRDPGGLAGPARAARSGARVSRLGTPPRGSGLPARRRLPRRWRRRGGTGHAGHSGGLPDARAAERGSAGRSSTRPRALERARPVPESRGAGPAGQRRPGRAEGAAGEPARPRVGPRPHRRRRRQGPRLARRVRSAPRSGRRAAGPGAAAATEPARSLPTLAGQRPLGARTGRPGHALAPPRRPREHTCARAGVGHGRARDRPLRASSAGLGRQPDLGRRPGRARTHPEVPGWPGSCRGRAAAPAPRLLPQLRAPPAQALPHRRVARVDAGVHRPGYRGGRLEAAVPLLRAGVHRPRDPGPR